MKVTCHTIYFADYNEAEVRFSTTDNIMKALCDITGCKIKLEDRVGNSDQLILDSQPGNTNSVSTRSISDYVLYVVSSRSEVKVIIVEVKTDITYSKHSIAQAIGYYISSQVTSSVIPMCLLLTQSKSQLIFFPFSKRDAVVITAVVTEVLDMMTTTTFCAVVSFVAKYIMTKPGGVSSRSTRLRTKQSYEQYLLPFSDYTAAKMDRAREKVRRAEEGKRRAEEGKRQAEEGKRQAERQAEERVKQAEEGKRQAEESVKQLKAELRRARAGTTPEEPHSKKQKI